MIAFLGKVGKNLFGDTVESVTKKIATLQSQQEATGKELQKMKTEYAQTRLKVLGNQDSSVREQLKDDLQDQLDVLAVLMKQEKTSNLSTIGSLQKQIIELGNELQLEKNRGNIQVKRFGNINEIFEFEAQARALPKRLVAAIETTPETPMPPGLDMGADDEEDLSRSASMR